jgi:glutamate N-acetyltransferase/amino-acid N-acetyltransferase
MGEKRPVSKSEAEPTILDLSGHASSPTGFRAGALACGLKTSGSPDLGLLVADSAGPAAALFTRNRVAAAPVVLGRETLPEGRGRLRAVLVNAGNANACTGAQGMADARAMKRQAAELLGCAPAEVLVLSTGVIGKPLDMAKVAAGIAGLPATIASDGGAALARAMMTTDTRPKHAAIEIAIAGGKVRLGGVAKGSGMIHPDMATMLAMITTDARIEPDLLARCLRRAVDQSFNRISVDGDTSTNDAVVMLASGASGVVVEAQVAEAVSEALAGFGEDGIAGRSAAVSAAEGSDLALFQAGLDVLCRHLALAIVRDGEGATRLIRLQVCGAPDAAAARRVADAIATSPLVKTALAGGDPNWGRIVAAAGRSGVDVDPERMRLDAGAGEHPRGWLRLFEAGMPVAFAEAEAAAIFGSAELALRLDLGLGPAEIEVWTCDLTADYVAINADYRS